MRDRRKITVFYQLDDSVRINVFTCSYVQVGDYSVSWIGQTVHLRMRDGYDEAGNRVHAKVFLRAWDVTITDDQEI